MNKELIQQARQTNLAEYLTSIGVPLKREGHRHRHKEHESLIFTKNSYYWNSRQEKGNAIDYLVNHMNMSFINAVLALTSASEQCPLPPIATAKGFVLDSESLNPDYQKSIIYLNETRCIENSIIDNLINQKLLFQEKKTNNIVFPIYDENNNCVGAELQGTTSKRFKGIKENSKYGHGFNIRFSNDNTFDYALFFESAIDLISFIDYKKNHENKSLERCILISMAGLKRNIIMNTLNAYKGELKIVLCVDNDNAGQKFRDEIDGMQIAYADCSPDRKFKDWNEQLTALKRRSPPVGRLLMRGIASNHGATVPTEKVADAQEIEREQGITEDR